MAMAGRWRRPERIPERGGALLAANHVSFLDPVVLAVALYDCGLRKVRFVALADLFDHPLVGWVLHGTRMIPVARGRGVERMAEEACAALEAGQAVLVYPEGTIVPPGQTRPARPGTGLVALRTSVPVLPIASHGVERRRRGRARGRQHPGCRSQEATERGPVADEDLAREGEATP
jgi:1-acyl-sn-glycerol-3-phosphate acyltransferase